MQNIFDVEAVIYDNQYVNTLWKVCTIFVHTFLFWEKYVIIGTVLLCKVEIGEKILCMII